MEITRDVTDPGTGVRYVEVTDNGWRYAAFSTPLPTAVEGGNPDTHALVTVYTPVGQRAWVFATDGYLSASYVGEHLELEGLQHLSPVVELVRVLLNRR